MANLILLHGFFFFLIFTNLQLLEASSSHDLGNNDFIHCMIKQFQGSNSTTDIIFTPQNKTYSSLLLAQNTRLSNSSIKPNLIITPFRECEIQAAIYCSRKLDLPIRVRSGGHDYEGLSYTSAGSPFLIVDMRNFRSVTVDDKEKTARVQVGATLGQLYHTISLKSKTLGFPAGACPTVGVGGHFSGGGYGMMSRKHSIAADHIIDARLINAAGEILDRKTMGEDLFWAIRGGGGTSFGIVLEFKVTLVTVPETVTVFTVTRTLEQNATELVHKWQHIADKVDENLLIRLFLYHLFNSQAVGGRTVTALFKSMYLGRAYDLMQIIKQKFPELGLAEEDCIEMSWIESVFYFANIINDDADVLVDRTPQGGFELIYYKGKSDYVRTPIPVEGLKEIWRFLLEEEGYTLQWSPYGGALNSFSESETPFPHRRGNVFMIEYALGWYNSDETEARLASIRRFYHFMGRYVSKSPRAAYINYRDLDIGRNKEGYTSYEEASVWGQSYFKVNFERLVGVKTRVDPSNFFRNEQSIPPLTSMKRGVQFKNVALQVSAMK